MMCGAEADILRQNDDSTMGPKPRDVSNTKNSFQAELATCVVKLDILQCMHTFLTAFSCVLAYATKGWR